MHVCVYHATMGDRIATTVRRAYPDIRVDVVRDTATAPPDSASVNVLIANTFPPGLLAQCETLRWLHLTGAGIDHVAAGLPQPDLLLTTSARVPARAAAEFAWMAVLALAKDAPSLLDQHRRREWRLPRARLIHGSSLLLVGLGRIGRHVATLARAAGVTITAITRHGTPSPLADRVLTVAALPDAAAEADHMVIAVPGSVDTAKLVSAEVLCRLPAHAAVVNVARASVLDTVALVDLLRAGQLGGAVLDVHDQEPLPADSPLWNVPGLWVTPHGAYRHPEEEDGVARVFLDNLAAFRDGRPLPDRASLMAEGPRTREGAR